MNIDDIKNNNSLKEGNLYKVIKNTNLNDYFKLEKNDYDEIINNKDNFINLIDSSKIYNDIKKDTENLNKLEDLYSDSDIYIANLFLQYCLFKGSDYETAIEYLSKYNVIGYERILKINPEFQTYVKLIYKSRQLYMNELYKIGVDLKSKDTIELGKGQYDTCVSKENTRISKYNSTISLENSILYRKDDNIYEVSKDNIRKISENSTFIIHNPYNLNELLYNLEVLAGTNNKVILGSWGLEIGKDQDKKISDIINILNILLDNNKMEISKENIYNIYCNNIIVNTKNIKKIIEPTTLLSESDFKVIGDTKENTFSKKIR